MKVIKMDPVAQKVVAGLSKRYFANFSHYLSEHTEMRDKCNGAMEAYREEVVDTLTNEIGDKVDKGIGKIANSILNFASKMLVDNTPIFESLMRGLVYRGETQDRLVSRLTKIAKDKGIERALEEKTIYSAIKQLFPDKKEYKQYLETRREEARKSLKNVGTGLNFIKELAQGFIELDGEVDEEEKALVESIDKATKPLYKKLDPVIDALLEVDKEVSKEGIDQIYKFRLF